MTTGSIERTSPLRTSLNALVQPAADDLLGHPYYQGLLDGTLPPAALSALCRQDAHHLLPTYARALARCAGMARRHDHAQLLARMALVSFESAAASAAGFAGLAARFGLPDATAGVPEIAPPTLHYTGFLTASSFASAAAGLGAVLPSAWLYQLVTDELMARREPEGRYGELLSLMYPGAEFALLIEEFLQLIDEFGAQALADDRDTLLLHVERGVVYERAFVDAAWQAGQRA
jgi:thiaminase/transcriptional activator TenA